MRTIETRFLGRRWTAFPGNETQIGDVARACQRLDLVPILCNESAQIGLQVASNSSAPPTIEDLSLELWGTPGADITVETGRFPVLDLDQDDDGGGP